MMLTATTTMTTATAGDDRRQEVPADEAGLGLVDHRAPVGGRRLDAEAEERQRGELGEHVPEVQGRLRADDRASRSAARGAGDPRAAETLDAVGRDVRAGALRR